MFRSSGDFEDHAVHRLYPMVSRVGVRRQHLPRWATEGEWPKSATRAVRRRKREHARGWVRWYRGLYRGHEDVAKALQDNVLGSGSGAPSGAQMKLGTGVVEVDVGSGA